MPSLHESITTLLGEEQHLERVGGLVDSTADRAVTVIDIAVPAILGGLARVAAGDGPETVSGLMAKNDRSVLKDLPRFLESPVIELDSNTAAAVFGPDLDRAVTTLASKADLTPAMVDKVLPSLIAVALAVIARRRNYDRLDAAGVTALLDAERLALEADGRLDPIGDLVSLTTVGGSEVGITSERVGGDSSAGVEAGVGVGAAVARPAKSDLASSDSASDETIGKPNSQPADGAVAGDGSKEKKSRSGSHDSGLGEDRPEDDERSALGWLGWAVGAVVLVLVLAWLLSTCTGSGDAIGIGNTVVEIDEPDLEGSDRPDGAYDGDGEIIDLFAREERGETGRAVPPSAPNPELNSDPEPAAPATTAPDEVAPATTAPDPDQARIQAAVEETLAGSAMTGTVSGRVVVLTGTAGSDGEVNDAVAALGVISGVALVDDQVEVVAPEVEDDAPPSGTTINDLIDLDPVTFDISSARITSTGRAVLDRAAEFMLDNPAVTVEIGGHTDNDGAAEENLDLSQRRAEAVKSYMEDNGVGAERMEARGFGELQPLVPNDSSAAKAENRRIEFTIL